MPDNPLLANGFPDPLTPAQRAFMGWGGPGQPADWYSAMGMTPDMNAGAIPAAPAGNYQPQYQPQQQTASTLPAFQPAVPFGGDQTASTLPAFQPPVGFGQQTASTLPAFQPAVPGAPMNSNGTLIGQQPPGQMNGQFGGMSPLIMALLQYFGGQGGGLGQLAPGQGSGGLTLADLLTGRGGQPFMPQQGGFALQMGANPSDAISPTPQQGVISQGGSTI